MAVLIEALNVIVRNQAIERAYPGGLAGYASDCPNLTFCADEHLSRVGFMTPVDAGLFIRRLENRGLVWNRGGQAVDLVVVNMLTGPTTECGWIMLGQVQDILHWCERPGTFTGRVRVPEGWTPRHVECQETMPPGEFEALRFLEVRGGLDVYIGADGKEWYLGRAFRGNGPEE